MNFKGTRVYNMNVVYGTLNQSELLQKELQQKDFSLLLLGLISIFSDERWLL